MVSTALLITAGISLGVASSKIYGVSPEKESLYEPTIENGVPKWHCLSDPSIVLSYSQINDDYCDCPDGSDEPGTNACPPSDDRLFYCANAGHIPGYLETFKLNDGTCDYDICCDGSDEYLSGLCPNKCKEIHAQFLEYKDNVSQEVAASLKVKDRMLQDAVKIRQKMAEKITSLKSELAAKEKELENAANSQLESEEEVQDSVFDKLEPHVQKLSGDIDSYKAQISRQQKQIEYLENSLSKLTKNYNPNFNDIAVKEAVRGFQEYASNKEETKIPISGETSLESLVDTARGLSYNGNEAEHFTPSLSNMVQYYWSKFASKPVQETEKVPAKRAPASAQVLDEIETEIKELKVEIKVYEEDLTKDYGPEGILRAAASSWVSGSIGEYTYKLGFLSSIYQDNVLIGNFKRYEDNKLYYADGHKCWNGPYRSAVVELVCGSKHEFLSIREPEKCEYHFEVVSPIACEEFSEEQLYANFKIDYSRL